jgi:hypothetical protein
MSEPLSLAEQALALRLEQARRWRNRDRAPAEQYLGRHPELNANPEYALEVVYGEILLREEDGEVLGVDEFLQRFPQFASQVQRLFDVHRTVRSACVAQFLAAEVHREDPPLDVEGAAAPMPSPLPGYKRYGAAARLYTDTFKAQPKLADDLQKGHRYNAACSAAQAAEGQGADAALDAKERTRLRQQALAWLRADLALHTKQLASAKPEARAKVQKKLRHWQQDSDLAGIREEAAVAKLPTSEQQACLQLWAEVQKLLGQAHGKP